MGKKTVCQPGQRAAQDFPRDVLYESGDDDVTSGVDDLSVIADFVLVLVQGTFVDGENGPLVSIYNDESLNELAVVGKKDPGAMEDKGV